MYFQEFQKRESETANTSASQDAMIVFSYEGCNFHIKLSQVVKSQVSTGTRTQGLWRTVPALYPLSY